MSASEMVERTRLAVRLLRRGMMAAAISLALVGFGGPSSTVASASRFGAFPHNCKPTEIGFCMIQTYLGQVHVTPRLAHVGDTMTASVDHVLKRCFQFTPCVGGVAWNGLGLEVDSAGHQTHAACDGKALSCTFTLTQAIVDQGKQGEVPSGQNNPTTGPLGGGWEFLQVTIGSGIGGGVSTDYFGVLAPGEYIDEATLGAHVAPAVTSSLRAPNQVSLAPIDLARSALLAAALLFLIGFPGQLFNSTMQAHYDEVIGWFAFLRRQRAGAAAAEMDAGVEAVEDDLGLPRTPPWVILAVFVLSAGAGSFIDPKFSFDLASLEGFLGTLGAIAFTTLAYTGASALVIRYTEGRWGRFRVFPAGIVVLLFCAAISKLTSAQPGYLYGVVLGYSLGRYKISKPHEGRLVAIGSLVVLIVSLGFWLAWTPVRAAADATNAFPLVVLSTLMASIFMGGMGHLIFGLAPMSFLDGEKLFKWRRAVWIALFAIGVFLFVHVVLNATAGTAHPGRNYAIAIGLFLGFGIFSTAFWAYFRYRPAPAHQLHAAG